MKKQSKSRNRGRIPRKRYLAEAGRELDFRKKQFNLAKAKTAEANSRQITKEYRKSVFLSKNLTALKIRVRFLILLGFIFKSSIPRPPSACREKYQTVSDRLLQNNSGRSSRSVRQFQKLRALCRKAVFVPLSCGF